MLKQVEQIQSGARMCKHATGFILMCTLKPSMSAASAQSVLIHYGCYRDECRVGIYPKSAARCNSIHLKGCFNVIMMCEILNLRILYHAEI